MPEIITLTVERAGAELAAELAAACRLLENPGPLPRLQFVLLRTPAEVDGAAWAILRQQPEPPLLCLAEDAATVEAVLASPPLRPFELVQLPTSTAVLVHRLRQLLRCAAASEQALAAARERLDAALDAAEMTPFEYDLASGDRTTHSHDDRVLGRGITHLEQGLALIHPDDRARVIAAISASRRDGSRLNCELRIEDRERRWRWLSITGQVVDAEGDRPGRLIGVTANISVRKAAEHAREVMARRLQLAASAAELNVWSTDLDTGVSQPGNRDVDFFGHPIHHIDELLALVHPDDRAALLAPLEPADDTRTVLRTEFRVPGPNGTRYFATAGSVGIDPDSGRRQLYGVTYEITPIRTAEAVAREAADQLALMMEAAQVRVWRWNLIDGTRLQSALDPILYGESPVGIAQMLEHAHPEDRGMLDALLAAIRRGEVREFSREFRVLANGVQHWIAVHGKVDVDASGRASSIHGVSWDTTELMRTRDAQHRAEQRLIHAASAGQMLCWEWDLSSGRRTVIGDQVRVLGCSPTDIQSASALIHPDDRAHDEALIETAIATQGDYYNEFRIILPDGRVRWLMSRGVPTTDDHGGRRALLGVAADITARKAAELVLAESQQQLRDVIGAARMLPWRLDDAGFSVGGDLAALLGPDAAPPRLFPADRRRVLRALARLRHEVAEASIEFRLAGGSEPRWFEARGRAETVDGRRRVRGLLWDIQERRRQAASLEEAERWRQLAVDAAGLNIFDIDLASGSRRGGPLDLEYFGTRPASVAELEKYMSARDVVRMRTALEEATELREPFVFQYTIERPGRPPRAVAANGRITYHPDGRPHRAIGVLRDITAEQRQADLLRAAMQAAQEAGRAKSAFLASMSHEIRTPMNAVIGMTGLLLDTPLDARQADLARMIRDSGELLLRLINDILDFSKIEAGEMRVEQAPFLVTEALESVLELVAGQAESRDIALSSVLRVAPDCELVGDATRLSQIVLNLLSNAVKFTEHGSVQLRADLHPGEGDQVTLAIRVRDTGVGMSAEVLQRLFKPFSQGDASTTRRYGGTGLGLAICKRLSTLMGGRIDVLSEPGYGSEFRVELPFRLGRPGIDAASLLARCRIGVVESSDAVRMALEEQLVAWGAEVVAPAGNVDADALPLTGCGIVLLDETSLLDSDRLGAPATARRIRMTRLGYRPPGSDRDALWLTRPIRPSRLLDTLLRALDARRTIAPPAAAAPAAVDLSALRILVAEDNPVNQVLAQMLLESLGCRSEIVGNGYEVLDALRRAPFDVILMDIEMPDMDGIAATRAIRARQDLVQQPVIIAVTAHVLPESRAGFLAAGMDACVNKPILVAELREVLEALAAASGASDRVADDEPASP